MPVAMARHILVKTEAEAAQLKQRLAKGEVRPGQMVRSIDNAIFRKPVGVLQGPLKSQFGYHLLEVYFRD